MIRTEEAARFLGLGTSCSGAEMLCAVQAISSATIATVRGFASVCPAELEIWADLDTACLASVEMRRAMIGQGVLARKGFADFLAVGSCAFLVFAASAVFYRLVGALLNGTRVSLTIQAVH